MSWFPDEPQVPVEQHASGPLALRYEDISQDGRIMVLALPHSIGDVVWPLLAHHPLVPGMRVGVIPILTRFAIEGGGGPLSVRKPLTAVGRYQLAHTVDERGLPSRILLAMWTAMSAPPGRMYGPPPSETTPVNVGRVYAEHVFTRLFAPAGERRVLSLDAPGMVPVPPDRVSWRPPEDLLAPPPGFAVLDEHAHLDAAPVCFGLQHSDSNQHINSLVYPRLFQEAALRRFVAHGRSTKLLPRRLEVAYRKPCFAGDSVDIALRAFADGEQLCATGAFVPRGEPEGKPYSTVRVVFGV